jgi:hypothetical protein
MPDVKIAVEKEPKSDELTDEENRAYLDARIRRKVQWAVRGAEANSFQENNEPLLQKVAARIYDDVVGDFQFDKAMLKATRAVKFNVDYVAKVVRAGLAAGTIVLNEAVAKELDYLAEGILSAEDLEERIQGITNLVARDSLRR